VYVYVLKSGAMYMYVTENKQNYIKRECFNLLNCVTIYLEGKMKKSSCQEMLHDLTNRLLEDTGLVKKER